MGQFLILKKGNLEIESSQIGNKKVPVRSVSGNAVKKEIFVSREGERKGYLFWFFQGEKSSINYEMMRMYESF